MRVDNGYSIPNYNTQIDVCRTNTPLNTAYRAYGDIQGVMLLENAIEDAAVAIGMDSADLREKNLYQLNDQTPGGQTLEYCYLQEVWDYTRERADYNRRKSEVDAFNAANKWRKRGICMMPLKYGSGFNLVMLEQTTALISVYSSDGTILIKQGGADMGQGMVTKLTQLTAFELNVPIEIIRIDTSDTSVIPNPSSTGASTGTQYNGMAIKQCCDELRERLKAYCQSKREEMGDDWCTSQNIDYWNYPDKWKSIANVENPANKTVWQFVISAAFNDRINLQVQSKIQVPGGEGDVPNISFKPIEKQPRGSGVPHETDPTKTVSETVNPYVGFTYNAGCAEVEVDILTGEKKILRADIVYDMGRSLNPAIDIGQIEGAFMQGVGYVLTENIVYEDHGPTEGATTTLNTWRYKPPAITTVPLDLRVDIFPRHLTKNVPENPNTLYSSKEVGEPPFILANAVFFAIKAAVRESRNDRGLPAQFEMSSPASVQTVRLAAEVQMEDLDT